MDEPASTLQSMGAETLPVTRPALVPTNTGTIREAFTDSDRPGKRARLDAPVPMTAAAAVAEARQHSKSPTATNGPSTKTSPNPATEALGALLGGSQHAVSKVPDVPNKAEESTGPTNKVSEGLALAVEHLQPPQSADVATTAAEPPTQTSPTSTTSYDAADSITAPSGMGTTVASPQPLEASPQPMGPGTGPESTSPGVTPKNLSYPTPLLQPSPNDRRGMSLPHSGLRQNTRSPSSRKHQCPFCNTEFTRHHNLKSHLLTHSQEKPYVCSTCNSRFRRLHDLKRHTKLHTGERPHICPKCNRKFARGDALARHNKGPGGCAGRRASMGSFGGDDDMDGDDSMEGVVVYGEPEPMEDVDDGSGNGAPRIRRHPPSMDDTVDDSDPYSRIASTYPPIQGRPPGGIASGNFPPRPPYAQGPGQAPSGAAPHHGPALHPPGSLTNLRPSNHGSVFAPNSITESPKAISPRQTQRGSISTDTRMQSPSVPHFQPPSQYNRSMSGSGPALASQSAAPQLPPPHALNPPDARYTLASQAGPTHPPTQPSGPPTHMSGSGPLSSHSNSLSSHGQSGPGSGDHANSMFNKEDRLWAYVKDLESRMTSMQEEINNLKNQLSAATASQQVRT